jgi:hypothetical protein
VSVSSGTVSIKNCFIENTGGYGITGSSCQNLTVENTSVTNCLQTGIRLSGNSLVVRDSILSNNGCGIRAGGSDVIIERCFISNNEEYGIHIRNLTSLPLIVNNFIWENSNGIYIYSPDVEHTIRNNTIVNNELYGIRRKYGSAESVNITNCIIWNPSSDDLRNCTATYSCIEDSFDANDPDFTGSINSDPCFVDVDSNDFHLNPESNCIETGDPNTATDSNETDIDDEPRIMPTAGQIDMGADELGCLSRDANEYDDWAYWDFPDCWCYQRQCRGDSNGGQEGPFWVSLVDLNLLRDAVDKQEADLRQIPNGICADFDHQAQGPFRVSLIDLNIIRDYINQLEADIPCCDADQDCVLEAGDKYNFWTN